MKKITFILLIMVTSIVNSQNPWQKISSKKNTITSNKTVSNEFKKIEYYSIDMPSFKENITTTKELVLPNFYGNYTTYELIETSNFTKELSSNYSSIKSYSLKSIEDNTTTGKLSIGSDGVHAILFSGNHKTLYIDPSKEDKSIYVAHTKGALNTESNSLNCLVEDQLTAAKQNNDHLHSKAANDGNLKVYRLALACTGEYAQFHIEEQEVSSTATDAVKKEAVLSAMNTTITRVNAIFERDVAVRFSIIINDNGNNDLIFLDADTDDLNNNNPNTLISQSQLLCDNVIGTANYDIGHTFSTGAGGLASLASVCSSNAKGLGVTGSPSPIGDTFDIDFVAHEIGHQFGATHTFNGSNGGNCDDANRNTATSAEPASGTTIMSYVGICAPINIQNTADAYFHALSIENMQNVLDATSCATEIANQNTPPLIAEIGNVSVPKSTPLNLKSEATDAEDKNLTYCWEQIDLELVSLPLATNIAGPIFRSLPPTTTSNRYLPTLETVVAGSLANEWEVIPEVSREINFSLTVRDNNANGGATARENISISVIDTEPFTVNTPNNLIVNTNQTITWNVGETNISPINATNVNIKLSTDGGVTFPFTLIENTTNDGSEEILIPTVATTQTAIILIEASDNIFYNISTPFAIINSSEISLTNTTGDLSVCTNNEISYEVSYAPVNNFSETVSFEITNAPNTTNVTISPDSLNEAGIITVTVTNVANLINDTYSLTLKASSPSIIQNLTLNFEKISDYCESVGFPSTQDQTSITEVNFADISNTSERSTSGYSNFEDIATIVNIGDSHDLSVNINTDGSFRTQTRAWIDWNQNCTFDDSEQYDLGDVFNQTNGVTSNSPLTITVPDNAEIGATTMRVITMSPSTTTVGTDFPSACQNLFFGETEDYTITINNPTASTEDSIFGNFNLYPNPSQGIFNLNFEINSQVKETTIILFDITGKTISTQEYFINSNTFSEQLNFSNLNTGLYLLQIINGNHKTIHKVIIE